MKNSENCMNIPKMHAEVASSVWRSDEAEECRMIRVHVLAMAVRTSPGFL